MKTVVTGRILVSDRASRLLEIYYQGAKGITSWRDRLQVCLTRPVPNLVKTILPGLARVTVFAGLWQTMLRYLQLQIMPSSPGQFFSTTSNYDHDLSNYIYVFYLCTPILCTSMYFVPYLSSKRIRALSSATNCTELSLLFKHNVTRSTLKVRSR